MTASVLPDPGGPEIPDPEPTPPPELPTHDPESPPNPKPGDPIHTGPARR